MLGLTMEFGKLNDLTEILKTLMDFDCVDVVRIFPVVGKHTI